jgi:hypothetical protein
VRNGEPVFGKIDVGPGQWQRFARDPQSTPPSQREQRPTLQRGETLEHTPSRGIIDVLLAGFIDCPPEFDSSKRIFRYQFGVYRRPEHLGTTAHDFGRVGLGNRQPKIARKRFGVQRVDFRERFDWPPLRYVHQGRLPTLASGQRKIRTTRNVGRPPIG